MRGGERKQDEDGRCVSFSPPRGWHQDRIRYARILLGEMLVKDKGGGDRCRHGECSDLVADLTPV